jgi:crotonobetainyl-CoA:carnitine CoA-transferase CaiB-like acyl-CoA transferase
MKARDRLRSEIADIVGGWTLAEARAVLDGAEITYSVVQNLDEVMVDPQARAAGFIVETGSEDPDYQLTVANPVILKDEGRRSHGPAPEVGEHSRVILAEAGYSESEIDGLIDQGAVAAAGASEA